MSPTPIAPPSPTSHVVPVVEVGQEDDPLLVHVLGGRDHHVGSGLDQTVGALVGVVLAQVNLHRDVVTST